MPSPSHRRPRHALLLGTAWAVIIGLAVLRREARPGVAPASPPAASGRSSAPAVDPVITPPFDVTLSTTFDRLAARPDDAIVFARAMGAQFPEMAPDVGAQLVAALGRAGAHEQAAGFAVAGEGVEGVNWTTAAFFAWGRAEPQRALAAVEAIADADRRQTAFQALVSGWAKARPQELLDAYPRFPPGWDQRFAVLTGLRALLARNPAAAEAWMRRSRLPFDFDWELVLAE